MADDERTDARERAMMLLYEADNRRIPVADVVAAQVLGIDELTTTLIDGVVANQQRIDAELGAHARGWTLARMPAIDRTVLRIAAFELLARAEVPVAVVIDEAVELVKTYSTDDSGRFVNGVLSALVPVLRTA